MAVSAADISRAMYETLPDPVLVTDTDAVIVAVNAAALAMFGHRESELVGLGLAQLEVDPEEAPKTAGKSERFRQKPQWFRRICSMRRKDGGVFRAELTVNPVVCADGNPTGWVTIVRDLASIAPDTEDRLRTKQILKSALASMSEGFVIYDEADRLVLCNDAYREMYAGCAPAMKIGETFESIIRYGVDCGQYPEAGATTASREAWIAMRLDRHRNPGAPFLDRIGEDRWIQIDERITADNFRVGLRTDVSALTHVKTEIERLGNIIENVAQEVYVLNLKTGKFISANKRARDNLQYSLEELRQMSPLDINPELSELGLEKKFAALTAGEINRVLSFDAQHRRKDGTRYPCRVNLERINEIPEPVVVAFVEDITRQLAYDRALKRRQSEYETLVRSLPDLISRAKPDTTLTYVSEHYARFKGMKADEMVGRKFLEFIPPDKRPEVMSKIAGLTPEMPIKTMEREMRDTRGEHYWYSWTNLMVYEGGKPVEIVSVGRDVTESHLAKERITRQSRELIMRNDALEQFAAIVSHDLKAPLRQIRLFAGMIAEDVSIGKTADLDAFSRHITDRGKAMERMISSLLEYSQLAYQAIQPEMFRLSDAIAEAWNNLAVTATETGARLLAEADVGIFADPQLMIQLFQNLFANSMKYREPETPSEIRVRVVTGDAAISISVEDNGIGIDPKHADAIFGAFQRLYGDERKYAGSGLGLALCQRIVESHGGSIRLDPSCRTGARFVIELPNAAA